MTDDGAAGSNLSARLTRLWPTRREGGRALSDELVAAAINALGDTTISPTGLWKLRTGRTSNPSIATVTALAKFFGVPVAYLAGEADTAERIDAELDLLLAMRAAGVHDLAVRAAELTPGSLRAITSMVDTIRRAEAGGATRDTNEGDPPDSSA